MKKFDFGQAISILANVGVIAGIVFLAMELQQSNALLRAEARQIVVQNRATTLERWAGDAELMRLRLKAHENQPLTLDEQWRLDSDLTALLSRLEFDYEQYQDGLIGYLPVGGWRALFIRWPYMREIWAEAPPGRFTPVFVQFLNENDVNER